MKVKIGDRIKLNKKRAGDTIWYSNYIYTITGIEKDANVVKLDKNLPNSSNLINIKYLKLLKKERKKKLLKLNSI